MKYPYNKSNCLPCVKPHDKTCVASLLTCSKLQFLSFSIDGNAWLVHILRMQYCAIRLVTPSVKDERNCNLEHVRIAGNTRLGLE